LLGYLKFSGHIWRPGELDLLATMSHVGQRKKDMGRVRDAFPVQVYKSKK
jgi:hypothetical protein